MHEVHVFSIGEFSKITGLTVKTLRFYHEEGILVPTCVDDQSGYRYYDAGKIETARVIAGLRELEFPLSDIKSILAEFAEEGDILDFLERQRTAIAAKVRHYRGIESSLSQLIAQEREARAIMVSATASIDVQEKTLQPQLVAGIRMRGRYSECGQAFGRIARKFGRYLCGKPLLLHYDCEYHEQDADFEACMPIRQGVSTGDIQVHTLPGGICIALLHQGAWDAIGPSYARILQYAKDHKYELQIPTREVYLKGPGMIFRGNPKKYVTEIQMLIGT